MYSSITSKKNSVISPVAPCLPQKTLLFSSSAQVQLFSHLPSPDFNFSLHISFLECGVLGPSQRFQLLPNSPEKLKRNITQSVISAVALCSPPTKKKKKVISQLLFSSGPAHLSHSFPISNFFPHISSVQRFLGPTQVFQLLPISPEKFKRNTTQSQ